MSQAITHDILRLRVAAENERPVEKAARASRAAPQLPPHESSALTQPPHEAYRSPNLHTLLGNATGHFLRHSPTSCAIRGEACQDHVAFRDELAAPDTTQAPPEQPQQARSARFTCAASALLAHQALYLRIKSFTCAASPLIQATSTQSRRQTEPRQLTGGSSQSSPWRP